MDVAESALARTVEHVLRDGKKPQVVGEAGRIAFKKRHVQDSGEPMPGAPIRRGALVEYVMAQDQRVALRQRRFDLSDRRDTHQLRAVHVE